MANIHGRSHIDVLLRFLAVLNLLLCVVTAVSSTPIPEHQMVVGKAVNWAKHRLSENKLCDVCVDLVGKVDDYIMSNKTFDDIRPYAIQLCHPVLEEQGYNGTYMCPGFIDTYGPPAWFIAGRVILDPKTICGKLKFCEPNLSNLWPNKYDKDLVITKKERRSTIQKPQNNRGSGSVLRILQLSDIHVDPYYSPGSAVHCKLYLCCRSSFNGTGSAGNYGEYDRCDLPLHTLDLVLSAIQTLDPAPDFIVYTGDSPPHDVWQESWTSQLNNDDLIVEMMASKLKNFTIYPAIGNHESFPESFYYQPRSDYQHLNFKLADWWGTWFDVSEEQRETIEHSAYYTALVRPGLRLLSFNSDYGYALNFYFLLNDQIAAYADQIAFMRYVLEQARQNNEKVIIAAHVPPGDLNSATMEYGDFYTSLVSNYSDVIAVHLFGHTHHDMFELVSNRQGGHPVGVVLVAPSVTPYSKVNPGFRVYQLDGETFELIDYDQYYLNLTEANLSGKTDIKLLYSAKAEYGLSDLSAESWKNLSDRFDTDDALFKQYRRNYFSASGQEGPCDQVCKKKTICETKSASLRAYLSCLSTVKL